MEDSSLRTSLETIIKGYDFGLEARQEICKASGSHASQLFSNALPLETVKCESCGTSEAGRCEGHFAYAELPTPIYHPDHVGELKRILSFLCLNCLKVKKETLQISINENKTSDGAFCLELKVPSRSRPEEGCWNFLEKYGFCYGDNMHTLSRPLLPSEERKRHSPGVRGTTVVCMRYRDGFVLNVDSRCSNEKNPLKKLNSSDLSKKCQKISPHTLGVMVGGSKNCLKMFKELENNCANKDSVSDIYAYAEDYMEKCRNQNKQFGIVICGSDKKGSRCQLFSIYVDGDDVVKESGIDFLTIGSGSRHARRAAHDFMSQQYAKDFDYGLSLEDCINFTNRCLFEATFYDLSTGGPLCVYRVTCGTWKYMRKSDILDMYLQFYDMFAEDHIIFLVVNVLKAVDLTAKQLVDYFRPHAAVLHAHRVCSILMGPKKGFYFHRIVCRSSRDASDILAHATRVGTHGGITTTDAHILKVIKEFPHFITISEAGKPSVECYVEKASKSLLNLLGNSRLYHETHGET